jgi:hypothetical protein
VNAPANAIPRIATVAGASSTGAKSMKACRVLSIVLATAAGAWSAQAAAIEPIPQTPGWGGFAVLGVGYTELKTNMLAGNAAVEIGRETVASINSPPQTDSAVHPVFTGELNYTTRGRWQLFVGNSLEDALTLDTSGQLGVRREVGAAGVMQAGVLFNGITTKVWSDPYAEGVAREETDRDSSGARFQWDRIFGSAFQATLSYRDISVDEEASGQGVRSVTCNAACRDLLRRDGDRYNLDVSYLYRIGDGRPRHLLRPQVSYSSDDRDGDAISSKSWRLQLSHVFLGEGYTLASNFIYGSTSFDERNPIFGRKTDSDRIAIDTTLLYRLPIEGGRWQAVGSATWGRDDSDVRFHDSDLFNVSVGAMYRFGN